MNIGRIHVDSRLVLAPMAGVTDLAFRQICRELGAGLTVTEMVSAKALCYQDRKTRSLAHGEMCIRDRVRSRPRSRKAAAFSAVEMPRAASTCDTSWG